MIGKRVQPNENGWVVDALNPGEYVRVAPVRHADGSPLNAEQLEKWWHKPYWLCCSPNGHVGNLEKHEVVEHDDGTITVSPSIAIRTSNDGGKTWIELYHGYLRQGVWSDA